MAIVDQARKEEDRKYVTLDKSFSRDLLAYRDCDTKEGKITQLFY